jgi:putative transposase
MKRYRRAYVTGGAYFFTVVTHHRVPWLTQPDALRRLRAALRKVRERQPFGMDAIVVLPDHLHAIWRLPAGDSDFSTRWRLIKHHVAIGRAETWRWQPRFWEHVLRDEEDWRRHTDYIHYNPVKHGYAHAPSAWPYSSFGLAAKRGWYDRSWGAAEPTDLPVAVGEPGGSGLRP